MPQMLVALDLTLSQPRQIVVAGKRDSKETQELLREVHRHFVPNKILLLADGGEGQKYLEEKLEALRAMKPVDEKPTAYVCENFACQAPVNDAARVGEIARESRVTRAQRMFGRGRGSLRTTRGSALIRTCRADSRQLRPCSSQSGLSTPA